MALRPSSSKGKSLQDRQRQIDENRQDVFMREVDDALREDQFADLMKRYGKIGLGVAAVLLVGLGGWTLWTHYSTGDREDVAAEYVRGLDAVDKANLDFAAKQFATVAASDQPGYRASARLMQASLQEERGNLVEAAKAFKAVAADDSIPQPYRDLALVRQTAAEFDTIEPRLVVDRLKPMAVPGNPWFGSAGELVGIAYIRMNQPQLAGPLFKAMADDENVPASIRERTRSLAAQLGVDTVKDPEEIVRNAQAAASARP